MRFSGLKRMLFVKTGWKLNGEQDLVSAPGYKRRFGGLHFIWYGIDKIHTYKFNWVKVTPDKNEGYVLEPKEEKDVSFILVGQTYVYGLNIRGKEVVDKDMVPVEISLALQAMIVNPRKALFDTKDWFNTFISLIDPAVRDYVNTRAYRVIIADKGNNLGKDVMDALRVSGVVAKLKDVYGIDLLGVECKGIKLEGKYQDEQTQQWGAEREAEANLARQEIESSAFAKQTALAELKMLAMTVGMKPEELQAKLKTSMDAAILADPVNGLQKWMDGQKKYWTLIQQKQLGARPNLFGNMDGSPMDPIMGALTSLIALAKGGSASSGTTGGAATPPPPWVKKP